MTDPSRRSATVIHHVPINYSSMWDENTTLNNMAFPATQDEMNSMFAYYDERAAGASPGDDDPADTEIGSFPRYAGYLAHHDVGPDGKPTTANTSGVSACLARLDTLPDNFYGASKEGVRSHLLAHQADMDPAKTGVNPSSGQAVGDPAKIAPTSSSGRAPATWDGDGDGDNDLTPGGDSDHDYWDVHGNQLHSVPGKPLGLSHAEITVSHAHDHHAHDAPDADGNGVHNHQHTHGSDDNHNHNHAIGGAAGSPAAPNVVGSSGREADDGHERADVSALTHDDSSGQHSHAHLTNAGSGDTGGAHLHMHAHNNDHSHEHTHDGVNATPVKVTETPVYPGMSSSGRQPDEGGERTAPPPAGATGNTKPAEATHDPMTTVHSHGHLAHGGPDNDGDGVHAHVHDHNGDANHEHPHEGTVDSSTPAQTTVTHSSGRQPDEGGERADGPPKPYGNVKYADPKNGKYPIDTHDHAKAAWSYINMPKNAAKYPLNGVSLSSVKSAIKAACKKFGIDVSDSGGSSGNNGSSSSSGRQPAALGTGPRNGHSAEPQTHPAVSSSREQGMSHSDTESVRMTVGERIDRESAVRARLAELDSEYMGAELPGEARAEWRALQEELLIHKKAIKDANERAQYLAMIAEGDEPGTTERVDNGSVGFGYDDRYAGYGNGGGVGLAPERNSFDRSAGISGMRGTAGPAFKPQLDNAIYDLTAIRNRARSFDEVPHLYREYAMRAVERARFPTPDKSREDCQGTIERLLLNVDDDRGTLARRLLVTGSPIYDRAFGKALAGTPINGLSTEESRALALGTDPQGGYAVPFQLDPTVILTSNGAINPLRQISRIEQIVGKEWDGVTSAGVTVLRVSEGTEAATGDAAFVQPKVRTTRVQGFVPFNIELDVSWGALRSQMTSLLMDAKDVEEATSFAMGSGTAPAALGVVQNAHDQAETVSTVGTATLAIGDLYALENAMPPRFRQQSAYLASKTTFNRFRQLFQAQASAAFDSWVRPSAGTPATFNGYPAYEQSAMGTTITSGSYIILQGDFSKFLIVDRVGMGIELIPHLFGGTNRYPLGQRGILAIWFNNSAVLVNNAFRLLVTT